VKIVEVARRWYCLGCNQGNQEGELYCLKTELNRPENRFDWSKHADFCNTIAVIVLLYRIVDSPAATSNLISRGKTGLSSSRLSNEDFIYSFD